MSKKYFKIIGIVGFLPALISTLMVMVVVIDPEVRTTGFGSTAKVAFVISVVTYLSYLLNWLLMVNSSSNDWWSSRDDYIEAQNMYRKAKEKYEKATLELVKKMKIDEDGT
jgi:hypothetical protein